MVNNVVPARAGEIARAYALTRESPVPFATSLASLAVDRLFDAIVLLLLAATALLDPAFSSGGTLAGRSLTSFALGAGTLVFVLLAGLYALVFFPTQLLRLFELFARKVSPAVEERGRRVLQTFVEGLSVLRSPARFAAVFGWTLAHWLLNALGFWLAFKAVGIAAPFSAALFLQAFIALFGDMAPGVRRSLSEGFANLVAALEWMLLAAITLLPWILVAGLAWLTWRRVGPKRRPAADG